MTQEMLLEVLRKQKLNQFMPEEEKLQQGEGKTEAVSLIQPTGGKGCLKNKGELSGWGEP